MADRFYGTADLIGWCKSQGWDYRLRLNGNLTAWHGGKKVTMAGLASSEERYFQGVQFTARRIETNIGIIHDPGSAEPWIVAMSEKPGYLSTLDYTKRWGIEPMFSAFTSRGFGIEHTHIHYP